MEERADEPFKLDCGDVVEIAAVERLGIDLILQNGSGTRGSAAQLQSDSVFLGSWHQHLTFTVR